MIPLAIGLVCLAAVWRLRGPRLPRRSAVPWMVAVAGLTGLQLLAGAPRIDPYRITLLGMRFDVAAGPEDGIGISGDEERADVWVSGAGTAPVGRIVAADGGFQVRASQDGAAAVLVRDRSAGGHWRVLGSRRLGPHDTVVVRNGEEIHALLSFEDEPDSVVLSWFRSTFPGLKRTTVRVVAGSDTSVIPLPGVRRRGLAGAIPRRPSVFQRTYPVADLLVTAGLGEPSFPLGSFFYYEDGELRLADLDTEIGVAGAGSGPAPLALTDGTRWMVAGLAHRDHPEEDLAPPARYGLRPLRSFRTAGVGGTLDLAPATPEIRSLSRDWLERWTMPGVGGPGYRVRVSGRAEGGAADGVAFRTVPARFQSASQAILTLAGDPRADRFEIVAPGGSGHWSTGRPMVLGTGPRALIVRVDGQATTSGFWLLHGLLFALPLVLVGGRRRAGSTWGLAVLASGFAALRLLLAWSAHLADPFVAEGVQLALWLVPVLPWAVVTAADVGRSRPGRGADGSAVPHLPIHAGVPARPGRFSFLRPDTPARNAGAGRLTGMDPRLIRLAAWSALATLTVALFQGSPGRTAILLAAIVAVALVAVAAERGIDRSGDPLAADSPRKGGRLRWTGVVSRGVSWTTSGRGSTGVALGLLFLSARVGLDLLGWREGIQLGATRVSVSALYTPAVLVTLALLLVAHGRRARTAGSAEERRMRLAEAYTSVGAFLLLAVLAVSLWISDFGIALVGLPGMLLGLAALGGLWATSGSRAPAGLVAAVPLALFFTVQAAPSALRPLLHGDGRDAESRMAEWSRNELLLLERGDPQGLGLIGQRRSEALAVMRETMRSYTRSTVMGQGYLRGHMSGEIRPTAPREHAVSALLASQWGAPGVAGLVLLLTAALIPATRALAPSARPRPGADRVRRVVQTGGLFLIPPVVARLLPAPWGLSIVLLGVAGLLVWGWRRVGAAEGGDDGELPGWGATVAALLLMGFAGAGIYMVLANYGLVFFTGKNVYLLGIDSMSDAVEGLALLAGAALALARVEDPATVPPPRDPRRLPGRRRPARALLVSPAAVEVKG